MSEYPSLGALSDESIEDILSSNIADPRIIYSTIVEWNDRGRHLPNITSEDFDRLFKNFVSSRMREFLTDFSYIHEMVYGDGAIANREFKEYVLDKLGLQLVPNPLAAEEETQQRLDWPWPISEPEDRSGKSKVTFDRDVSGLWLCGYRTGKTEGLNQSERRRFLDHYFRNRLPAIVAMHCGDEYSTPGSEARLRKMANVIASNCRNFKNNDRVRYRHAIADWESDLDYLKAKYYEPGTFPWPSTED